MPVYLLTYHAYGSWLPDRRQGYVKRSRGILAPDAHMHRLYAEAMKDTVVVFADQQQRHAIAEILESQTPQRFETYFIATDATHIHILLGWRDERAAANMKALVKGSLTRRLNRMLGRREWLSEGGSRKQVRSRGHFEHLMRTYLPKHAGWKWSRDRGLHR